MSRWIFTFSLSFLVANFASAQDAQPEPQPVVQAPGQIIFNCRSVVKGFESFHINQLTDEASQETAYFLQAEGANEFWKQSGKAQLSNTTPMFQSEFKKKRTPPVPPPVPLPTPENPNPVPPPPTPEDENNDPILYIFVSINPNGTGSLSVYSDLAPIRCVQPTQ
jgi:hypothetical protein